MDRHLLNVAFIENRHKEMDMYPFYDNGLSLYSTYSNDAAIELLDNCMYNGNMGSDEDVRNAILLGLDSVGLSVTNLVRLDKLDKQAVIKVISRSDKFGQTQQDRRDAMTRFIMNQLKDLRGV